MEIKEFNNLLLEEANKIDITISKDQLELFYKYMNILLEWNKKINLTAITEEKEIVIKHFIDSISINKYIKKEDNIMDMGTGAGFPGIPLKILNKDTRFVLVDSLNKRIKFLEEVNNMLNLNNIELIHSRAENLAKNFKYRENMDTIISRAVANLRVLVEYMIPFIKVGGLCICMKGPNIKDEIEDSRKAIEILGGKIEKVENIHLIDNNIERNLILIRKIKETPIKYPRKAGIPLKQPL